MITKEVSLAKVHILDEREPDAVRLGLNMQVQLRLTFVNDVGAIVGELNDYPVRHHPDITRESCFAEATRIIGEQGFPAVPQSIYDRMRPLCEADHPNLLTTARWKLVSTKAAIEHLLRAQPSDAVRTALEAAYRQLALAKQAVADLGDVPVPGLVQESRMSLLTVLQDGQIQVRIRKCICQDGELISPPQYHRTVLAPTGRALVQL